MSWLLKQRIEQRRFESLSETAKKAIVEKKMLTHKHQRATDMTDLIFAKKTSMQLRRRSSQLSALSTQAQADRGSKEGTGDPEASLSSDDAVPTKKNSRWGVVTAEAERISENQRQSEQANLANLLNTGMDLDQIMSKLKRERALSALSPSTGRPRYFVEPEHDLTGTSEVVVVRPPDPEYIGRAFKNFGLPNDVYIHGISRPSNLNRVKNKPKAVKTEQEGQPKEESLLTADGLPMIYPSANSVYVWKNARLKGNYWDGTIVWNGKPGLPGIKDNFRPSNLVIRRRASLIFDEEENASDYDEEYLESLGLKPRKDEKTSGTNTKTHMLLRSRAAAVAAVTGPTLNSA